MLLGVAGGQHPVPAGHLPTGVIPAAAAVWPDHDGDQRPRPDEVPQQRPAADVRSCLTTLPIDHQDDNPVCLPRIWSHPSLCWCAGARLAADGSPAEDGACGDQRCHQGGAGAVDL